MTMEETMAAEGGRPGVHPAQFEAIDGAGIAGGGANLELLLDVTLRMTVQLGKQELAVKDVLSLGNGSVIELDKLGGEPLDDGLELVVDPARSSDSRSASGLDSS